MKRVCWLGLALTVACSDALEQTSSAGQVIGVVNAADNTVSFVSATDFSVRTVDLGIPRGAATTAAGRGGTVIVPLGPADSVAVIHNAGLCTTGVSMGVKAEADPNIFLVKDGKLYVFSDVESRAMVEKDPTLLTKAHQAWDELKK